jgi:hypothetical protein
MAVDSEDKRRSVVCNDVPGSMPPVPDTSMQPGDRRHMGDVYRMLLPGTAGPVGGYEQRKQRGATQ